MVNGKQEKKNSFYRGYLLPIHQPRPEQVQLSHNKIHYFI